MDKMENKGMNKSMNECSYICVETVIHFFIYITDTQLEIIRLIYI